MAHSYVGKDDGGGSFGRREFVKVVKKPGDDSCTGTETWSVVMSQWVGGEGVPKIQKNGREGERISQ